MSLFKDMSKGLQEFIKGKIEPSKKQMQHKDPLPILSADTLLATEKRQQGISEIRNLLNFPEEEFNRIFLSVLENFAEFVQNLPETERSYYANVGGILDHAIERASLSLFLCRTYLLPQDATLASVSEAEMLWVYALYTASLVYDIGKIAVNHVITLTDEHGNTLQSWLPFKGSMTKENASHYVFGFSEEHYDHMRWQVTALLARQILPEGGFNWIASDLRVLESWLGLLSDDYRQVSPLLSIVQLVESLLQEGFYTGKKVFRNDLSPQSILALSNKAAKDRKDLISREKERREKSETENLNKIKDRNITHDTHKTSESAKTTNQSLFGFPVVPTSATENKTGKSISKTSTSYLTTSTKPVTKETIGKFLEWLKQNETANKEAGYARIVDKQAVLSQVAVEKFLSENKLSSHSVEKFKQALVDARIISPNMAAVVAQETGVITPALQFLNPFVVFYTGIPPVANIVAAAAPPPPSSMPATTSVQTVIDSYMEKQAEHAKQPQQNQSPTPTLRK